MKNNCETSMNDKQDDHKQKSTGNVGNLNGNRLDHQFGSYTKGETRSDVLMEQMEQKKIKQWYTAQMLTEWENENLNKARYELQQIRRRL